MWVRGRGQEPTGSSSGGGVQWHTRSSREGGGVEPCHLPIIEHGSFTQSNLRSRGIPVVLKRGGRSQVLVLMIFIYFRFI